MIQGDLYTQFCHTDKQLDDVWAIPFKEILNYAVYFLPWQPVSVMCFNKMVLVDRNGARIIKIHKAFVTQTTHVSGISVSMYLLWYLLRKYTGKKKKIVILNLKSWPLNQGLSTFELQYVRTLKRPLHRHATVFLFGFLASEETIMTLLFLTAATLHGLIVNVYVVGASPHLSAANTVH